MPQVPPLRGRQIDLNHLMGKKKWTNHLPLLCTVVCRKVVPKGKFTIIFFRSQPKHKIFSLGCHFVLLFTPGTTNISYVTGVNVILLVCAYIHVCYAYQMH